jgi:hypothetical protein
MIRRAARSRKGQQVSSGASIPPPVGGWDAISPLANMPEDRAPVLDNYIPRPGYVEVRRGHDVHGDTMGTAVVESLLIYQGLTSAASKMFCATDGKIFDVSASGAGIDSTLGPFANNRWQGVNFTTSGGKFLWICNGASNPHHYNGSAWTDIAASLTGVTATDIIHVNAHGNRLWFVFKDSTKAGYLATGAVTGAVTTFELGGLFTKGGYLVATGSWTRDGGSGQDDLHVFVSSRGQVAVYAGVDPSTSSNHALIGVFDLGAPIGRRCLVKVAGDLALVNIDGVLPLSKALETDRGAAAAIALTKNINNAMNDAARNYANNFGWELTPYAKGTLALLNVPIQAGVTQHQYVTNTLTGAWCRFKGMNANCWGVFQDRLFFGGNDGHVYEADIGSLDVDQPIDAIGQTAYNYFKSRGMLKDFKEIQPLLTTDSDINPAIGLSTDFKDNAFLSVPSTAQTDAALWDAALWDTDVWPPEARSVTNWLAVGGNGYCASVHFRTRSGSDTGGEVVQQINGFNIMFERGGML